MRSRIRLVLVIVLGAVAGCGRSDPPRDGTVPKSEAQEPEDTSELRDRTAIVRRFPLESDSWVLVDSTGTLWLPDALPMPFRIDGLEVRFSGRAGPRADPGQPERPIELLHIVRRGGPRRS